MARENGRTTGESVSGRPRARQRRPTTTSQFGVSRRENHDASDFYDRFPAPKISDDDHLNDHVASDEIWACDAREITDDQIADSSVALVVTSPPYFAGKEYETAIGEGHVPESYATYLDMLRDVFAACERKLEPGGRIAVNVANLGRKPYRSLASDVTGILQNELKLLLRGEIIWVKGKAAGGSCAWGTFQRPGNPVLRDLSERVIVASKGRFDRARPARERATLGRPSVATISADEFMDLTTDVWEMAPESATRVGHPAPFPVELPRRLIDLYTYEGDLVLDPFMGSGTTAVAAVQAGRHFVGFDTDQAYVDLALQRVEAERERLESVRRVERPVRLPAVPSSEDDDLDFQVRAVRDGKKAKDLAFLVLQEAGFRDIQKDVKVAAGVEVNFTAYDQRGERWYFDVSGAFSSNRPGLKRTDTLWKALGKASVLAASEIKPSLVLLTTDLPAEGSAGARALAAVRGSGPGKTVRDVVRLRDEADIKELRKHAEGIVR